MTEHEPVNEIDDDARQQARRVAEKRRVDSKEGRSDKGAPRNTAEQRAHGAEDLAHDADHLENTDREMDGLYATEGDNEVTEWRRHSDLDAPAPRAGYVNRFVRVRLGGNRDVSRFRGALREGWRPVKASSFPGHSLPTTRVGGDEIIGVEDLILCEMPERVFQQRQAYYREKLREQNAAIERDLHRESRDDVPGFGPITQVRRSRVETSAPPPDREAVVAGDDL